MSSLGRQRPGLFYAVVFIIYHYEFDQDVETNFLILKKFFIIGISNQFDK